MKNIHFILLFISSLAFAQQTRPEKVVSPLERVYVEAGAFLPLDGIKDKLNTSVNFGFWFRAFHRERENFEIGFNMTVPNSAGNFGYVKRDSIFNNRLRGVGGTIGIRYSARMDFFPTHTQEVEWFSTIGYSFMTYRSQFTALEGAHETVNKKDFSEVLSAASVGLGIRYWYKNVGVQAGYQWTPYHFFYDYLPSDFGSHSMIVSIVYKQ